MKVLHIGFVFTLIVFSIKVYAISSMKEDGQQVRVWNAFADSLYQLHQFNLQKVSIRTEQEKGGYSGRKNFYEETRYYNTDSGKLLSRIQRELANTNNIHLIEVFIYDKNNRIVVDYLAAYLPDFRNAPVQTLISVYQHNDMLRAFRQFDASGALINEQCEGELFNEPVFITLDEDEIISRDDILKSETEINQYYSCFESSPTEVGKYLSPANMIGKTNKTTDKQNGKNLQSLTTLIETASATSNEQALSYLKRADINFKLHKFGRAINDYTQALKYNDKLDAAYFGRGMALGREGSVQKGIDDLSVYLKRHPYNSRAYTKRGVRYIWLGNLVAAKKDLLEAVLLDVSNAEAHDDLGVIYATNNNYDKAIYHFKQSIYYDHAYQKAYHNLAMAYVVTKKYALALIQVEKGLLLQGSNRNTLLLKSMILEKSGKSKEAARLREQAEFLPEGNWSEQFSMN